MINIIPKPNCINELEGNLVLNRNITINDNSLASNATRLLSKFFDVSISDNPTIIFTCDSNYDIEGSYLLDIQDKIEIKANTQAGFLYAIESLRQLLPSFIEVDNTFKDVSVPRVIIKDYPRYLYRGYMIDSARHFFDKEVIKRKLDQMAMFKLNKLHFHLSDDQGFRVDIAKYPRLKEISAIRYKTKIKGRVSKSKYDVYDNSTYFGIYSKEDIQEIVKYASYLNIEVIPEIDSPGHLSALLASYNEYSCFNNKIEVKGDPGIFKDILCVGNENACDFVYDVILEVLKMFDTKKIHIGGDEAPLNNLKACPKCLEKARKLGFKNILDLKLDYSNNLARKLISQGYEVIGWNEITNNNYPKEGIIQLWSPINTKKAIKDVNKGRKVIVSNFSKFYLDYALGMFSLKKSYKYNPDKQFKKEARSNVIGVESPIWAEWVSDESRLSWQSFPKLLATSETAWTNNNLKDYKDFISRVDSINERFDLMGIVHASKKCYLKPKKYTILDLYTRKDSPSNIEYNTYRK